MRFFDFLSAVANNLLAKKLRSFLAVVGIVWGAYAVMMLAAIGEGMYHSNQQKLAKFSQPTLFVYAGSTGKAYGGFPKQRVIQFSLSDLNRLTKTFPMVKAVVPTQNSGSQPLTYQGIKRSGRVVGTVPGYFSMYPSDHAGRYLSQTDIQREAKVVFLSIEDREAFFGDKNGVGKKIILGGVPFTVIGYQTAERGDHWSMRDSFIPYSTYVALSGDHHIRAFRVWLRNGVDIKQFEKKLRHYLAYYYRFSPTDENAIFIFDLTQVASTMGGVFQVVRWFLIFCGIMTLLVGGIGVANMMYFIVRERTKEIGLGMALGATPSLILKLVLTEAILLVVLGGLIGMALTSLTLSALAHLPLPEWMGAPLLSQFDLVFIWFVLLMTSILSGLFPARRAALMLPTEALKG